MIETLVVVAVVLTGWVVALQLNGRDSVGALLHLTREPKMLIVVILAGLAAAAFLLLTHWLTGKVDYRRTAAAAAVPIILGFVILHGSECKRRATDSERQDSSPVD